METADEIKGNMEKNRKRRETIGLEVEKLLQERKTLMGQLKTLKVELRQATPKKMKSEKPKSAKKPEVNKESKQAEAK